jgi:N-acetylmuramoyl-L-alanine amidase
MMQMNRCKMTLDLFTEMRGRILRYSCTLMLASILSSMALLLLAPNSVVAGVVPVGITTTFTTLDHFNSWNYVGEAPWGPELEPIWQEDFDGNTAKVGVVADPGHGGIKQAEVGVSLEWDLQ